MGMWSSQKFGIRVSLQIQDQCNKPALGLFPVCASQNIQPNCQCLAQQAAQKVFLVRRESPFSRMQQGLHLREKIGRYMEKWEGEMKKLQVFCRKYGFLLLSPLPSRRTISFSSVIQR